MIKEKDNQEKLKDNLFNKINKLKNAIEKITIKNKKKKFHIKFKIHLILN